MATFASSTHPSKISFSLPNNINKMSVTQTFYLAHKARGKLSSEASRSDHNLRLLVGHANLLDSLMIHLSEAEAEQDRWYQTTVRGNETCDDAEEYGSLAADYESDSESESDDEEYEEEEKIPYGSYARTRYPSTVIGFHEVDEDYEDEDYEDEDELEEDDDEEEEEDDGMFALTRTTSHRPPSLCSDESDEEEEDEAHSPPASPQPAAKRFPEKLAKGGLDMSSFFDTHEPLHDSESPDALFEQMGLPTMITTY